MKKKIYIAGKVTGLPQQEVAEKFARAQEEIEAMGFEVVNPVSLVKAHLLDPQTPTPLNEDEMWDLAMKLCLKAMLDCDAVVLLPCWETSRGAGLEYHLADELSMYVFNYSRWGLDHLKTIFL